MLLSPWVPADTTLHPPPSLLPAKKYCDITGLEAPYRDPKTTLQFHSKEIYEILKTLVSTCPSSSPSFSSFLELTLSIARLTASRRRSALSWRSRSRDGHPLKETESRSVALAHQSPSFPAFPRSPCHDFHEKPWYVMYNPTRPSPSCCELEGPSISRYPWLSRPCKSRRPSVLPANSPESAPVSLLFRLCPLQKAWPIAGSHRRGGRPSRPAAPLPSAVTPVRIRTTSPTCHSCLCGSIPADASSVSCAAQSVRKAGERLPLTVVTVDARKVAVEDDEPETIEARALEGIIGSVYIRSCKPGRPELGWGGEGKKSERETVG